MRRRLFDLTLALALSTLILSRCSPAGGTPTPPPAPDATLPPEATATSEASPLPTPGSGEQSAGPSDPVMARDAVLGYVIARYGDQAPGATLAWAERRTTPQGQVGAEQVEYTAGTWVISVSYPVVAPENVFYQVVVANPVTGFHWEGEVSADGEVAEFVTPEGGGAAVPTPGAGAQAELVRGNSEFALNLYRLLSQDEGNLFFSPYSISQALAMTYAGARGETEQEMAQALRFTLPGDRLALAFRALDQELAQRGKGAMGKDGEGFRFRTANALWGMEGYAFLPGFLELLDAGYGAGLQRVDFGRPEEARAAINDWVSKQTEGKIEDLIPPGVLQELTRLVLTNAIYFNAAWQAPFDSDRTQDGPFHRLDGSQVSVPMMSQSESLHFVQATGTYQAVEMPYEGAQMSMVILLPAEGKFEEFERSLDAGKVDAILGSLSSQQIALTMPRFEFDSTHSLKEALSELGMPLAFTPQADLSGMDGTRELSIDEVLHKAFVSVDEAGTEAAAATAVVVGVTSAPPEPVPVSIDRPFLFLIRDLETGAILFLGRVVDPSV